MAARRPERRQGSVFARARGHKGRRPVTAADTILVVDPDHRSGRALCDLLSAEGYHSFRTSSGEQALHTAERHRIGIAIIEHTLRDVPGGVLARHLRGPSPSIRVAFTETWIRGSAGIYRYGEYPVFTKPLDAERVLAWIAEQP